MLTTPLIADEPTRKTVERKFLKILINVKTARGSGYPELVERVFFYSECAHDFRRSGQDFASVRGYHVLFRFVIDFHFQQAPLHAVLEEFLESHAIDSAVGHDLGL